MNHLENSNEMINLSQEIVKQAIQISNDNSNTTVAENSNDIEYIQTVRHECLQSIYNILEDTDFSKYSEISAIFEKMIEQRNHELSLEDPQLKVNEKNFKVNKCYNIVSQVLFDSDTFKPHNENIEKYLAEVSQKMQNARNSIVEFNNEDIQSLAHTHVLWAGWECDSLAWVIEQENKNILLTTDHGEVKITDKSFLENKIKEYEKAIEDSKKLLALLN